jgi:hypothetical protein
VALYTDVDGYDETADAVTLMTLHAAKGLEFPSVFIPGLEEGLFRRPRTGDPEQLEEERRLANVGITRAKKSLTLLTASRRMLFGQTSFGRPSRFLGEIPANCSNAEAKSVLCKRPDGGAAPPLQKGRGGPCGRLFLRATRRTPRVRRGNGALGRADGRDVLLEIRFDRVGVKASWRPTRASPYCVDVTLTERVTKILSLIQCNEYNLIDRTGGFIGSIQ